MNNVITINGLCFILENHKGSKEDYPYKMFSKNHLRAYMEYANRLGLGVLYISNRVGVCYCDDIVEPCVKTLSQYNTKKLKYWSRIVAYQIVQECYKYSTLNVHLMCRSYNNYKFLIKDLRRYGLNVITPVMGYKEDKVDKVLEGSV